jgi:hypothetical protein
MLKDQIFKAQDAKVEPVEVPEWGVTLYVKTLSGSDRAKLRTISDHLGKVGRESEADTHLLILSACDQQGNRVFNENDFAALNEKNASIITKVAVAALKVNGLGADAVEDAKKN